MDPRALLFTLLLVFGYGEIAMAGVLNCPPLVATNQIAGDPLKYPQGLVWRVTAAARVQSVIIGTMHVSDPRVHALADIVREELGHSDTFVMEVVLDIGALARLQQAMFYSDGRSLREIAGAEVFERTAAQLLRYGVPARLAEVMKPWAAFTTLSMPAGQTDIPLDMVLMLEAQAAGKAVLGLETVADQIAVFEALTESEQVSMLLELTCHYDVFQAEVEAMVERYAARDLAGLMALSLAHVDAGREPFLDALLWRRNTRMVERLRGILDAGRAFVAVGALHLVGPRGILERLEQLGYEVERIY